MLTATTARVVFSTEMRLDRALPSFRRRAESAGSREVEEALQPASTFPCISITSPYALTTTNPPTTRSSERYEAEPSPPFMACSMPIMFPDTGSVPAGHFPCVPGTSNAFSHARRPIAASGRIDPLPTFKSKIAAAGTIGMVSPYDLEPDPFLFEVSQHSTTSV